MARVYIADCKGFTTGKFTAGSDRLAVDYAVRHFSESFTNGLVEVWDVDADQLVLTVTLTEDPFDRAEREEAASPSF